MYEIESHAMEFLLAGSDPELGILRDQFALAMVAERENTGVGFFTKFQVPNDLPRLGRKERIIIGDVYGEVEGNEYGVGLLLFIFGLIKYVVAAGDEKKIEEAKRFIVFGLIAFFVMFSVWGLTNLLVKFFFPQGGNLIIPQLK